MICPEVAHRFVGDNGIDLFNFEFEARFPDDERRRVVLRLGHPFKKEGSDVTWIRSELENLDFTEGPLAGLDSMQAIVLGIRWLVARLESFQAKHGCQYFWCGGEQEFDFHTDLSTVTQRPGTDIPAA